MINALRYRNFKSWEDTGELRLGAITGFFGTNSSGKTSLLQGLLLLKQTIESSDRNQILDFGDESKYVDLGSAAEIIFGRKPGEIRFELDWILYRQSLSIKNPENPADELFAGNNLHFQAEIELGEKNQLSVKKARYGLSEHYFNLVRKNGNQEYTLEYDGPLPGFRFVRQDGRKWPLPAPLKFYGFPDQVKAYYRNTGFLSDLQLELEKLFQRIFYLGPLRENPKRQYVWKGAEPEDMGRRGQRAVDAILVSDSRGKKIWRGYKKHTWLLGQYVAYWLRELGLITSFEIKEISKGSSYFQVWVKKSPDSEPVLITDVGFGVSQILPVITLCYYVPEGSIVLIEQPEIHLHPRVQAGLADVFIDAIKHRGIQIVLESHSEHLLRRIQRRLAEGELDTEQISLYFCEIKQGKSAITPLDVDEFGSIRNWPPDFFGDEFGEIAAINLAKLNRLKNP